MNYTKHGEKRIRKRQKVSKKNVEKEIENALEYGLTHSECKGKLKKYVDRLFFQYYNSNIRIYKYNVFIFTKDNKLITTYALPGNLHKIFKKIYEK